MKTNSNVRRNQQLYDFTDHKIADVAHNGSISAIRPAGIPAAFTDPCVCTKTKKH